MEGTYFQVAEIGMWISVGAIILLTTAIKIMIVSAIKLSIVHGRLSTPISTLIFSKYGLFCYSLIGF